MRVKQDTDFLVVHEEGKGGFAAEVHEVSVTRDTFAMYAIQEEEAEFLLEELEISFQIKECDAERNKMKIGDTELEVLPEGVGLQEFKVALQGCLTEKEGVDSE